MQRRRWRLRKRRVKIRYILKDGCMEVQEKENEVVVLCSLTSSTKRKNRQLYSNGKELCKKTVMHVQSFCFANLNLFSACF